MKRDFQRRKTQNPSSDSDSSSIIEGGNFDQEITEVDEVVSEIDDALDFSSDIINKMKQKQKEKQISRGCGCF